MIAIKVHQSINEYHLFKWAVDHTRICYGHTHEPQEYPHKSTSEQASQGNKPWAMYSADDLLEFVYQYLWFDVFELCAPLLGIRVGALFGPLHQVMFDSL